MQAAEKEWCCLADVSVRTLIGVNNDNDNNYMLDKKLFNLQLMLLLAC